jgi:hypothetical protein
MKLETLRTRLCAFQHDVGWLSLFLRIEVHRGPPVVEPGRLSISVSPGRFSGADGLDAFAALVVEAVTSDVARAEMWRDVLLSQTQLRGPLPQRHAGLQTWLLTVPPHPDPTWKGPLGRTEPLDALPAIVPTSPIDLALLVERLTAGLTDAASTIAALRWAGTHLPPAWLQLCVVRFLPVARQHGAMGEVAKALHSDPAFRRVLKRYSAALKM